MKHLPYKKLIAILLLQSLFLTSQGFSQQPKKYWDKSFGGNDSEQGTRIIKTANNEYLVLGISISPISGSKTVASGADGDAYVIRIDQFGNRIWEKSIGGSGIDVFGDAIELSNGEFILLGYSFSGVSGQKTQSSYGGADFWLVKISSTGDVIWDKSFGGAGDDFGLSIKLAANGDYLLFGVSDSDINTGTKTSTNYGDLDLWVNRVSPSGVLIWDKTFGGSEYDLCLNTIVGHNGNFISIGESSSPVSGNKTSSNYGDSDAWLIEIDENGNLIWEKTYGGSDYDFAANIELSGSGNYIFSSESSSVNGSGGGNKTAIGVDDYWVVKINNTGAIIWDKTFGGSSGDYPTYGTTTDYLGNIIFGGYTFSGISGDKTEALQGNSDVWLICIDHNGTLQWDKSFGGSDYEYLRNIVKSDYNGYLMLVDSESGISGDKTSINYGVDDLWVLNIQPCESTKTFGNVTTPPGIMRVSDNILSESIIEGNTLYDAKNHILLKPGFETESNSVFRAEIGGCI